MTGRLSSLDAFRGATIALMILVNNPGNWGAVYAPLEHADWHGWTPTDLVFPFFLFIVGAAIGLAFDRQLAAGQARGPLLLKALRRSVVLFVLGLVLAGWSHKGLGSLGIAVAALAAAIALAGRLRPGLAEVVLIAAWVGFGAYLAHDATIRIPGVLQRIGVCYFLAVVLYLCAPRRTLPFVVAGLLLAYWGLMTLVPVPGHGAGLLDDKVNNLASYLDRFLLEGHIWVKGVRDPEGPLHTLTALCTTLFGVFAAGVLQGAGTPVEKALRLCLRGLALVVVGYAWSYAFPINKALWTSSYAVFTAGLATCALGACYWFVDVRGPRRWAEPLVTYGLNAITVFVGSGIVGRILSRTEVAPKVSLKEWIHDHAFASWLPPHLASLGYALTWVAAWFVVLRGMRARGWIVKV